MARRFPASVRANLESGGGIPTAVVGGHERSHELLPDTAPLADNVFSVHRITDEERRDMGSSRLRDCDNILEVFKSRMTGHQDIPIGLMFDERSKRFYMPSDPDGPRRRYGWLGQLRGVQLAADTA